MFAIKNEKSYNMRAHEQNEYNIIESPEPAAVENVQNRPSSTEIPSNQNTTHQLASQRASVTGNTLDEIIGVLPSGPGLEPLHDTTTTNTTHPTSLPPLKIKELTINEEDTALSQEEEHKMYQIWTISCHTHCSVVTVMEYCGQFIKIEVTIIINDSCLCYVNSVLL